MSSSVLLLKTVITAGLYAVSAAKGLELGKDVAASWLSDQLPSVFRSLLPGRLREPEHVLAKAFQAALEATLIQATGKRNPLRAFQEEYADEWNSLHAGQREAIKDWLAELSTAGKAPLIPVNDAFLKSLAEDRTGAVTQNVQRQLRAALRQRLAKVENQSDPDSDRADALFIDWFSRQIGTQLSVHFWEQIQKDEAARTAYFGLVAECLQQLLSEVAGQAVGTRQDLQKLSREEQERYQALITALGIMQKAQADQTAADQVLIVLISRGQERMEQSLTVITTRLARIDESVRQLAERYLPRLVQSELSDPVRSGDVIAITHLNYRQRLIPFQPRPVEMDRLDAFLQDSPRFAWWGIIGEGGMGKSRLAQELVQRCQDSGWEAGFLERGQEWMKTGHLSWQPDYPTLIVLDYASERAAELLSFLAALHDRADRFRQPVRILLLDRPGSVGPLFSDLLERQRLGADGYARLTALRALWQPQRGPAPQTIAETHLLQLEPPPPSQWVHYFDLTLAALGQPPRPWPALGQEFWRHIARISHNGRPLYLQMAAIALHQAVEGEGLQLTTSNATDLLDEILRHELQTRWPIILQAEGAEDLEPSLRRAVGLVTFMRGLDLMDEKQRELLMVVAAVPTGRETAFQDALCALLPEEPGVTVLPPLQPDLLGERYLLLGGATPPGTGRTNAFGRAEPQPFFQAADWMPPAMIRRTGAVSEVLGLLVQDFPTDKALLPLLEAAVLTTLGLGQVLAPALAQLGAVNAHELLAVTVAQPLSWFPGLVHLARLGQPLPDCLTAPLVAAIRNETEPELQYALLLPLIKLREECGKDPTLFSWTTQYLLPLQEVLDAHAMQPPAAILAAQGAFNAGNDYGSSGGSAYFPDMERWLERLVAVAAAHPDHSEIQLALAHCAVNSIGHYGSGGPPHFVGMERWMKRLEAVAAAQLDSPAIQLQLVHGTVNAIGHSGSGGPAYFPAMEYWLERLVSEAAAQPKLPEMQLALAKGAFNACNSYGRGGSAYFANMAIWLELLAALPELDPEVMELLPDLISAILTDFREASEAADGALPPDCHALFQAVLVFCFRYPDLPLGKTAEGEITTTGMYAAIFLPPQEPPA